MNPSNVQTRWEVTIPCHFASLNRLLRMHWSDRHRVLQSEANLVYGYCRLAGVTPAKGRRRVGQRITLVGRDRRGDDDNRWKSLLDALVRCGRLVDDGPDWVERTPVEYQRGKSRSTTIIIEDV